MKVAFVASEIAPFASTGGLAEVAASLPRALQDAGVESVRIMPLFRRVWEGGFPLADTGIRLKVPVGFNQHVADVWVCQEPGPTTYFIRRDEFFDRSHLYNLPDRDYDDNFERFLFFQKAAVMLLDHLNAQVDIVHANDWQTGLVPLYLDHGVNGRGRFRRERTVFTIHNLAFQGIFPGASYALTNLPFSEFSVEMLEFYGDLNCLKAGIKRADAVTTVSRTYAEDIQREEQGYRLHGVLQSVQRKLKGILNGIDAGEWNPATDSKTAQGFSADRLAGKAACRADLAGKFGLSSDAKSPLLGMVTRLTEDKGLDLLVEVVPSLLENHPVSLAILGQGATRYVDICQEWSRRWPGRVSLVNAFDRDLGHCVIAGSDILLMPSKVEPCGLTQLFAMRYGTIPVVHATGGLRDTVDPVNASGDLGTGYAFERFTGSSFMQALVNAIRHFGESATWSGIMRRAMAQDFSWKRSAQAYIDVYQSLLSARPV